MVVVPGGQFDTNYIIFPNDEIFQKIIIFLRNKKIKESDRIFKEYIIYWNRILKTI